MCDVLQAGVAQTLRNWAITMGGGEAERASSAFDKVFVDVNGNRELEAVLQIVHLVVRELHAPFVVCKSRALHRALSAARTRDRFHAMKRRDGDGKMKMALQLASKKLV